MSFSRIFNETNTHLKLALSIQTQPILTTQRPGGASESSFETIEEHGSVLSGKMNPLSLANCSKQIGKNSVNETITNTSLCEISEEWWKQHNKAYGTWQTNSITSRNTFF